MVYLSLPRLTFSGLFETDVSTVNNDVRSCSVETFQLRFQTPSETLPDGRPIGFSTGLSFRYQPTTR